MVLHTSTHPLVATRLTELRLHDLSPKDFRQGIHALGYVLCSRAVTWWPLTRSPRSSYHLFTPIGPRGLSMSLISEPLTPSTNSTVASHVSVCCSPQLDDPVRGQRQRAPHRRPRRESESTREGGVPPAPTPTLSATPPAAFPYASPLSPHTDPASTQC